ncbi:MAG: glycosyltransferase family 39 protein [Candidatus Promineifilaceae bacterium]
MNNVAQQRWLWLLIAGYLLTSLTYGVMTPLFEAPDEHNHFFVALYMAETGRLPIAGTEATELLHQEAAQPPLYYWLGSWLIRPLGLTVEGVGEDIWFNRFVQMGDPSSPTNLNRFVHSSAENWPWSSWVLAAHLLRGFSSLFGAVTLFGIYQCAKLMWPSKEKRALLAVALVAFLPQFNFLHGYINNDVAIICFATLTLWQLIKLWKSAEPTSLQFILIGLTTAAAMLSKMSGLILLVYVLGFIGIWAWQQKQWSRGLRGGSLVLLLFVLLAGWLLLRNWQIYGDITAVSRLIDVFGGDREATLLQVFGETSGILWSMIGVFGWFNVLSPPWVYSIWIVIVSVAGFGSIQQRASFAWLPFLLSGWIVAIYAGMVIFMLRAPGAQGRLLFPALVPLALGVSYGLSYFLERRLWLLLVPTVIATWFVALFTIPSIYRPMATLDTLPEDVVLVEQQLTPEIALLAYRLRDNRFQPRDTVWIDLYWQSSAPVEIDSDIVFELFGRQQMSVGKLQTLHGGGLYPASFWPTSKIVPTQAGVRLDKQIVTPTQAKVNLRVVDAGSIDLGFVKVGQASDFVAREGEPLARFGGGIELISAEINSLTAHPGDLITVDVRWQVTDDQQQTLSTLVHLGPIGAAPLAQGDSTPLQGAYPTHWWSAGEQFNDQYVVALPVDLPAGRYPLRIGFYDSAFARLAATPDDGDMTFKIGEISVEEKR